MESHRLIKLVIIDPDKPADPPGVEGRSPWFKWVPVKASKLTTGDIFVPFNNDGSAYEEFGWNPSMFKCTSGPGIDSEAKTCTIGVTPVSELSSITLTDYEE